MDQKDCEHGRKPKRFSETELDLRRKRGEKDRDGRNGEQGAQRHRQGDTNRTQRGAGIQTHRPSMKPSGTSISLPLQ